MTGPGGRRRAGVRPGSRTRGAAAETGSDRERARHHSDDADGGQGRLRGGMTQGAPARDLGQPRAQRLRPLDQREGDGHVERQDEGAQRRVLLRCLEEQTRARRAAVEVLLHRSPAPQRKLAPGHRHQVHGRDVPAHRRRPAQVGGQVGLAQTFTRAAGQLPHGDVAQPEPVAHFGRALAFDLEVPEHGAPPARQGLERRRRQRHVETVDRQFVGAGGQIAGVAGLERGVVTDRRPFHRLAAPRCGHVAHGDQQVGKEVTGGAVAGLQGFEHPGEGFGDDVLGDVGVT